MNTCVAGFAGVGRTRIWGFRPPDPPLRSGTPLLKLLCVFWLFLIRGMCIAFTLSLRGRVLLVLMKIDRGNTLP
jgi:hypothetical protein